MFLSDAEDAQRKHSFDDARSEFEHLKAFYPECGYTVAELAKGTVTERADFLAGVIAAAG